MKKRRSPARRGKKRSKGVPRKEGKKEEKRGTLPQGQKSFFRLSREKKWRRLVDIKGGTPLGGAHATCKTFGGGISGAFLEKKGRSL